MAKDEWIREAMTDDMVVVELLVRLKQPQVAATKPNKQTTKATAIPPSWGLKQPRSKILLAASRWDDAVSRRKSLADSSRCSPTTPLSWSGGASPSLTADGFEESSQLHHSARSKATATSGWTNHATHTKRSRKRKTFAELKEEEGCLLEERVNLRKELATLHATFKVQRAQNENLKRIKLDFVPNSRETALSIPDDVQSRVLLHSANPTTLVSCDTTQTNSKQESSSFIPDLNMMPSEEDFQSET